MGWSAKTFSCAIKFLAPHHTQNSVSAPRGLLDGRDPGRSYLGTGFSTYLYGKNPNRSMENEFRRVEIRMQTERFNIRIYVSNIERGRGVNFESDQQFLHFGFM